MITRIEISEPEITHGQRKNGTCCPVALGFRRAGFVGTAVGTARASLPTGNTSFVNIGFPYDVHKRIILFDRGQGMEPFSFDIDIPQEAFDWQEKRPKLLDRPETI